MTFSAYIQRQKSLIRSRRDSRQPNLYREGNEYEPQPDSDYYPEQHTQTLLEDLINLKGLNTAERQRYSKIFSHA